MTSFGAALVLLKEGKRVARAGWNGKGMWLILVTHGYASESPSGIAYSLTFDSIKNPELRNIPVPLPPTPALPFIAMKTADDSLVPWLASQTDILAADWELVS